MNTSEVQRAIDTVTEIAAALGLAVHGATVPQNSNKLALRLLPCEVFARVAYQGREVAQFEVDLAQALAESGSPVAALDLRVEGDYAAALEQLHAGLRQVALPSPHFTGRIAEAQQIVANRAVSPALAEADRALLQNALRDLRRAITKRGAPEQLLHGEPHPGNVLHTVAGPVFIDLETCCRGPIEFDVAHAPEDVSDRYPGLDLELLRDCRVLVLAMVAAWRWDKDDQFPDGLRMGTELLGQVRSMLNELP